MQIIRYYALLRPCPIRRSWESDERAAAIRRAKWQVGSSCVQRLVLAWLLKAARHPNHQHRPVWDSDGDRLGQFLRDLGIGLAGEQAKRESP